MSFNRTISKWAAHGWLRWLPIMVAVPALVAASSGAVPLTPVRFAAATAIVLQVALEIRAGRTRFMTSPLFLLSFLAVVFFSLVQGIWGLSVLPFMQTISHGLADIPAQWNFLRYVGSNAEGTVLAFGMAGLVFYVISSQTGPRLTNGGPGPDRTYPNVFLFYAVSVFICFVSLANGLAYSVDASGEGYPAMSPLLRPVTPVLVSISLFYLARTAIGRGRRYVAVFVLAVVISLTSLFYAH